MIRISDWIASVACGAAMIFANNAQMDLIPKMVTEYGAFAGLVIYFIVRDQKREQRMAKRINELENYQQNELTKRIEKSAEAMHESAVAVRDLTAKIADMHAENSEMLSKMAERPCLIEGHKRVRT